MAITYTELVSESPLWLYAQNRDLLVDNMPKIIRNAHNTLIGLIDHDIFKTRIDALTVGPSTDLLDLSAQNPAIMEVRAIRFDHIRDTERTPIERRELEFLTMLYSRNKPGRPRYYAEFDGLLKFRVFPFPSRLYNLEVTANVEPAMLSNVVASNIIALKYPNVMIKACLREAALFMKNMKDVNTYEAELGAAMTAANLQTARRRRDETAQRPQETANAVGK